MIRYSPLVVLFLLLSVPATVFSGEDGGQPGSFILYGVGARPIGLGQAFTGLGDDAVAGYYNPAALSNIQSKVVSASFRKLDLDRKHNFFNFVVPALEEATVGLSWINAGVSDVRERDSDGILTGGTVKNALNSAYMTFSRRFPLKRGIEFFSLGVNLKYNQHNLANVNAYTIGFDFGGFVKFNRRFAFGIVLQNLVSKYQWDSGDYYAQSGGTGNASDEAFPLNVRTGASARLLDEKLVMALDVEKNTWQDVRYHVGGEYWLFREMPAPPPSDGDYGSYTGDEEASPTDQAAPRRWVGIRSGYDDGRLAFGLSLRHNIKWRIIGLDFTYLTARDWEADEQIVSMYIEF